jgi:hypothetical protein
MTNDCGLSPACKTCATEIKPRRLKSNEAVKAALLKQRGSNGSDRFDPLRRTISGVGARHAVPSGQKLGNQLNRLAGNNVNTLLIERMPSVVAQFDVV